MNISPMLLETASKAFNDPNNAVEPKIDGHRLVYTQRGDKRQLYTRHGTIVTNQYPELMDLYLSGDFCLDGEVCISDPETGKVDIELISERFALSKSDKIKRAAAARPVNYIVWDIPYYNKDLTKLPLVERRKILEQVLPPHPLVQIVPQFDGMQATNLFEIVKQQKLEGIVLKKKNSPYVTRRSSDWLKIIRWEYEQVALVGYDKKKFGWLTAVEENGQYRPTGLLRLGTSPQVRKEFYDKSRPLIIGDNDKYVLLQPEIKALVKIRNWTRNKMLRDPVFYEFIT